MNIIHLFTRTLPHDALESHASACRRFHCRTVQSTMVFVPHRMTRPRLHAEPRARSASCGQHCAALSQPQGLILPKPHVTTSIKVIALFFLLPINDNIHNRSTIESKLCSNWVDQLGLTLDCY